MDKVISVTEARRKLPELLRKVESGQSYVLTSRGRPVARIRPVEQQRSRAKAALLKHLRSQKAIDIGPWTRDELYD